MSKDFVIVTDTNCDLPWDYYEKNNIVYMPMGFTLNNVDYSGSPDDTMPFKDFYNAMRNGSAAKTVALSMEYAKNTFENIIKDDKDVLYIAFSSNLSGTYNSGRLAKVDLKEEYPQANICIVDSLCASLGHGLMVDFAVNLQKEGKTLKEVVDILEAKKQNFCSYFTVDDLNHLYRGGRLSKTNAILGSVLGIKPIMFVNSEGKLVPCGKIRGRKKALEELVNKMEAKTHTIQNSTVFISHGDCEEDAKYVADLIKKKFKIKKFLINYVGNSIGSHTGAGVVALFFLGDNRDEKTI